MLTISVDKRNMLRLYLIKHEDFKSILKHNSNLYNVISLKIRTSLLIFFEERTLHQQAGKLSFITPRQQRNIKESAKTSFKYSILLFLQYRIERQMAQKAIREAEANSDRNFKTK